ncbi:MAG: DUF692 family protein [Myxococcales bacterium]|nr:DUF692 family protein [Myxococcales bacterium]
MAPGTERAPVRPYLGHGVGLRTRHYPRALAEGLDVDWIEAISENFLGEGGRPLAVLERLRRDLPIALHGVGLGIGSPEPPPAAYLARLRRLADRIDAAWISDHLCWTRVDGIETHELLPLPLTEGALALVSERVQRVQEALGRRILLENVSSYVAFAADAIPEAEFLAEVARRADCLILLDLNNVLVSAHNHGLDPAAYLDALPGPRIWQLHLARHSDRGSHRFDDHCGPVLPEVWGLLDQALARFGPISTIVEWDEGVPEWAALRGEQRRAAARARAILGDAAETRIGAQEFMSEQTWSNNNGHVDMSNKSLSECDYSAMSKETFLKDNGQRDMMIVEVIADERLLGRAILAAAQALAEGRRPPPPDEALRRRLRDTASFPLAARLEVYAASHAQRLADALAHTFPVLAWTLGDGEFRRLSAAARAAAPSRDPDLGRLGGALPGLLARGELPGARPWIADLAALEWALCELIDAADPPSPPLGADALARWSPERWSSLRFAVIPALRVLTVPAAIPALWSRRERGDPAEEARAAVEAAPGEATPHLLWRRAFEVLHRPLAPAEAAILGRLAAGDPLGAALDAGLRVAPTLEPAAVVGWLRAWLAEGLFAAVDSL